MVVRFLRLTYNRLHATAYQSSLTNRVTPAGFNVSDHGMCAIASDRRDTDPGQAVYDRGTVRYTGPRKSL